MRSPMPSTSVGSYGAAMNETMPATTDVISDAIEYARSQPWNAAAAKPWRSEHQYEHAVRRHDVHRTAASLLRSSGKNNATMLETP